MDNPVHAFPTHGDEGAVDRLGRLAKRLRFELEALEYPPSAWMPDTKDKDGRAVLDVAIVGGGMAGLVAAFALFCAGIFNLRIFDRNPSGREGPWVTYARMRTLRSPKQLSGPAYGIPSLTFRAWFEAQHGRDAWIRMDKIPRTMWMDYLNWYRHVLSIPVENDVEVAAVEPCGDLLSLTLHGAVEGRLLTRKVVLATGRDGLGGPAWPAFARDLPRTKVAHSSDPIDFDALKGRRVIVVGIGASGMDNAAEALEHGAAEVRILARRKQMPLVNKLMGVGHTGFNLGYGELPDVWRWRIMRYAFTTQVPAPHGSTLRVSRHPNAYFHFGCGIESAEISGEEIVLHTVNGRRFTGDFLILGTGFTVEHRSRPELSSFADKIALWRDRYTPPDEEAHRDLSLFPYLDGGFAFTERVAGTAPLLRDIYCFNAGAALSLGKITGDIPAISEGATRLIRAVVADFYRRDVESHWQALKAYEVPELQGDEWQDADLPPAEVGLEREAE